MPQDIEFRLPFPARGDPARGGVRDRGLAWARAQTLVVDPLDEKRFRDSDIAGLMARWLPDAEGADLDLPVNAVVVATALDDQFDGAVGNDPDAVARVCAEFVAQTEPVQAVPRATLGRAFADVWRRISDHASSEWLARTRMHWHWYLDAYVEEATNRAAHVVPTIEEYFALRRKSGFVYAMLDLSEKAGGFETSSKDRQPQQVRRMLEITADVVDTLNDVHSVEKEESRGDVHNLVLVIERERRCTRRQSLALIRKMVGEWCQEFEVAARTADHGGAARRLVQCMRDAMSGYLAWSRTCRRYSQLIPPHEPASVVRLV